MQSSDLTREQLEILQEQIRRQGAYLSKLMTRMEKTGFHPLDPIYKRVVKAHDANHELWVHIHYAACGQVTDGSYPRELSMEKTGDATPVQTTHPRHRSRRR